MDSTAAAAADTMLRRSGVAVLRTRGEERKDHLDRRLVRPVDVRKVNGSDSASILACTGAQASARAR
eukprot:scaffold131860_cov10-Tisochrysis_lutea.AAC.1